MNDLRNLLSGAEIVDGDDLASMPGSIAVHPAQVRADSVFFKCRYPEVPVTAAEAIARGARSIVIDERDPELDALPAGVSRTIVRNVNQAYAIASANAFGNVHRKLTLIGVTGTKGKTTTCHLIHSALRKAGLRAGLVSSLVMRPPEGETRSTNTTPEPLKLHSFLNAVHRQGGTHVVLEVSSIGISNDRIHGLRFAAVGFTNIGTDHFDYHGGREPYVAAKRRLFEDPALHASPSTLCAINVDDPLGHELASSAAGRVMTFGLQSGDLTPAAYRFDARGMSMRIAGEELSLPLVGDYNAYNVAGAVAIAGEILGSHAAAVRAMSDAEPLAGRLQRVPTSLGVDVYVDFAHTPESVQAVLGGVSAIAPGRRRVAVIGCSGKSDRGKRPLIARAAAEGSDVCILTSDNPNYEHPASILRQMVTAMGPIEGRDRVRTVVDRASAIAAAIDAAMPDGIVVLMGKGTETTQLIEGRPIPHNDYEVAASVLRSIEQR